MNQTSLLIKIPQNGPFHFLFPVQAKIPITDTEMF